MNLESFTDKGNLETTYGEKKSIKKVNQYKLIMVLGEGSFAKVFLGLSTIDNKFYALKRIFLKELCRTTSGISQLEREIETMRQMQHPNILALHEVIHIPEKSIVYLVIDYANCGNISSILEKGIRFTSEQTQSLFRQISEGIEFLHGKGLVHQDIKPANILLTSNGKILISDFGVGHSFQSAAMVVGTPAYQAPEVIDDCICEFENDGEDSFDPGKEDIWSLGVTLFEMAFGELPFYGANVFEIVRSIATTTLEKPNKADPVLWNLIENMLILNPCKRFNIKQVMDHPYVKLASTDHSPHFEPFSPESVDDMPIIQIDGTVCPPRYSFAYHDESIKKKARNNTTTFRFPLL